jgi:hypothetical protein
MKHYCNPMANDKSKQFLAYIYKYLKKKKWLDKCISEQQDADVFLPEVCKHAVDSS